MKLGFDIQPTQTEQSANRGIGRFTRNLVMNILELNCNGKIILFSNGLYKQVELDSNSSIIQIKYRIPKSNMDIIHNKILQYLTYQKENFDIFQIFSPFEGYPSNLPVINPYFDKLNSKLCTVIHDFIPLHLSEHYLAKSKAKSAYYKQLKTIYNSDILFAVSESTRTDVINILKFHPDKVITIGEGVSKTFYKISSIEENKISKIKKKFGIKSKFILYTGGIDYRKNIEKSIKAFSQIKKSHFKNTSYVIVCEIHEHDKKRLLQLAEDYGVAENVVFTGFITDTELNLLYNSCTFFVFPSLMEGFGLPLLEAMTCGAAAIGSRGSSIGELLEDESYMFNPENIDEISSLMSKMLENEGFRKKSQSHSLKKATEYSWKKTSNKVFSAYENLYDESKTPLIKKPRIAYFSPLPPTKSGISDYSSKLLPFLEKYWDIDLFVDDYECTDEYIKNNFDIYSHRKFKKLYQTNSYDAIVYQLGNSENHVYMFDYVNKYPGITILHDVYLSGALYWITGKVGKLDKFIEEVIYSHGDYGRQLVNKAKKNLISWDKLIWDLQINKRFIENSKSVVVHSDWDREKILEQNPQFKEKISLIHQPSSIRIVPNKMESKEKLGFKKDDFIICSFGFVVPTKKIDSIINNLKSFLEKTKNVKYIIVGDTSDPYGQSLHKLVSDLKLSSNVFFTDYIDEKKYKEYLDACDLCISLRTNARAGTSASINEALGAGIPIIISDDGPFTNFDPNCVLKLKPHDEKNLESTVSELYHNKNKLMDLAKTGQNLAKDELSIDLCVKKYVNIVNQVINSPKS